MRSRSSSEVSGQTSTTLWSLWGSCAQSTYTQVGSPLLGPKVGRWESMNDVIVPNFRSRVSRGEIFFNPMNHHTHEVASSGIGYEQRQNTATNCSGTLRYFQGKREGDQPAGLVASLLYSSATELQAPSFISGSDVASGIREVSTKVLSERGSAESNLYETLAELDQTLGLHHSLLNECIDLVRAARYSRLGRLANSAASLYLAYRYGIKPLIGDLSNLVKAMNVKAEKVRKSSRAQVNLSAFSNTSQDSGSGIIYTIRTQKTESVSIRGTSLDEYIMTKTSESGLGSKELMKAPWELVPFSFVLDWFVNLGDFYGAILPTPGLTQLGSCVVVERDVSYVHSLSSALQSGYNFTLLRPATGELSVHSVYRSRGAMTAPGIVLKSDFRFSNLTRCADAASLLIQQMMRFRR